VLLMIRVGFPASEIQKFQDGVTMDTFLNDKLSDKLLENVEEWTAREVDRLKKNNNEGGSNKKAQSTGIFIEDASFPEAIRLLPGEQVSREIKKVIFVSAKNDVAEGKIYISNFKLSFVGFYLQGPFDSAQETDLDENAKKKLKLTLDINFGSIFEVNKTNYQTVKKGSGSMWVPEGIQILTTDFQVATVRTFSLLCVLLIAPQRLLQLLVLL